MDSSSLPLSDSAPPPPRNQPAAITVSALTDRIKSALESIPQCWIEGEISNYKRAPSGHLYFTLKDARSQVQGVMFRFSADQLRFEPEDGMKVLCWAEITVYAPRGQYQIKVLKMKPSGVGDLQLAFEQLKRKLEAEGLFDKARKRAIPFIPRCIGVVTSGTGAAIRDILSILNRRFARIPVVVCPVKVQGEGAAEEIAEGIRRLNALTEAPIDVMIVGRGGGSIEDLWSFNEEVVARAIFQSRIPVVSAVGHEVDFTIADFVADLRAPTPSAAAELCVPERRELVRKITSLMRRTVQALRRRRRQARLDLKRLVRVLMLRPAQVVEQRAQQVDDLFARMVRSMKHHLALKEEQVKSALNRLEPLSPRHTLERGYAIATKTDDPKPITDYKTLKRGTRILVQLAHGQALCQVLTVGEEVAPDEGAQKKLPGFS